MTLRLDIEAESYAELLNKVINHLHLPCDIGVHVELRDKSAAAVAPMTPETGRQYRPEVAEIVPPTDSAPPAGEDAANEPETAEVPQRRKRRTKAEMEAARAAEAAQNSAPETLPPTPIEQAIAEKAAEEQKIASMSIFDDEPAAPAAPLPMLTSDEFREKLQAFAAREGGGGVKDVVKVLEQFKYASIKTVKPEDYGKIVAEVDAIFAKKAA